MVKCLVHQQLVVLFGLWILTQNVQAAMLSVDVVNPQLELGKALWVTLTSTQTEYSLSSINLQPWERDFVVARERDLVFSDDNRQQRLRLQLFPLRTGRLRLPALQFLDQRSTAFDIEVSTARDTKTHAPIEFICQVSTHVPWQRQQVIVACHVTTRDAHVQFAQPSTEIPGVQLIPMQVRSHREQAGDETQTVYQMGWVLLVNQIGDLHLQLPPIQYLRESVPTHQFYPPLLDLHVQTLPAWLPGTIPIGDVQLSDYRLNQSWLTAGNLAELLLQFQLRGVTNEAIPDYALQLRSDSRLQYYAAQQKLTTSINAHGLHQQLQYTIPLLSKHSGVYSLPMLRLQYFDPESGTLKTHTLRGPTVVVLNRWLEGLLLLVVLWFLVRVVRRLWLGLMRYVQRAQTYRYALQHLLQADSLPGIRQAMQTMAQAEGWSSNFTYQQWQARMQHLTSTAKDLAVADLNAASFGQANFDIAAYRSTLTRICRQRRFALH